MGPIVFVFIIFVSISIYRKKYSKCDYGKYYVPAIVAKLIGTIVMSFLYQYFFKGGDTFNYFNGGSTMFETLFSMPKVGLEYYFNSTDEFSYFAKKFGSYETKGFHPYDAETLVYRIAGWLSLITFKSYLGISFIITYFSFLGSWKLYQVFIDFYPKLYKQFAYGTLFVPTILLYGGGLMKDPIIMGAIAFFTHDIYFTLIKRKGKFINYLRMLICFYLIVIIKAYVIGMFLPPLFLWIVLSRVNKIKSPFLRKASIPIFIGVTLAGSIAISSFIGGAISERYKLENIVESSVKIGNWIAYKTDKAGGSGYSLGKIEPTVSGMVKKIPAAINVTFFRPYIWEVKGPAYYPIVLESFLTFLFTIYVFFRVGVFRSVRLMFKHPEVLFCISFALIFGFFVGFISSNFGALVRYKMPCLPFYYAGLIILLSHAKRKYIIKKPKAILQPNNL